MRAFRVDEWIAASNAASRLMRGGFVEEIRVLCNSSDRCQSRITVVLDNGDEIQLYPSTLTSPIAGLRSVI